MKKLLIITLTFFAIFAKAQNAKVVSKDSTTLYIGSNWLSLKYASDYLILNSNTDSIYSALWGGFLTGSTPTVYWETGGTGITPTSSGYAVGIGMNPTYEKLDVSGNIHASNFTTTYGLNTIIGENAGNGSSLGAANTICGNYAGNLLTGGYNSFFGNQAGKNSVAADYNSCYGYYSGSNNTNGDYNSFFGARSGYSNSSGNYNTYMGYYTGNSNYSGSYNIFMGSNAGATSEVGSYDIFIGPNSGYNNDGNANVFIGYNSGYNETGSNKLYIENTNSSSPLIYGEFDNDILKVNGDFRVGGSNGVNAIISTGDTMATMEAVRTYVSTGASIIPNVGDQEILYKDGDTISSNSNLKWDGTNLHIYSGSIDIDGIANTYVPFSVSGVLTGDSYLSWNNSTKTLSCNKLTLSAGNPIITFGGGGSTIGMNANIMYLGSVNDEYHYSDISYIEGINFSGGCSIDTGGVNNYLEIDADSIYQIGWFKTDSIYTIKTGAWADYVFNPDYKSDIYDKEFFINKYGHLPGLKSAEELDKIADKNNDYLPQNEYNRRLEGLVKEVEELTLQIIQQQKEIDKLKSLIP